MGRRLPRREDAVAALAALAVSVVLFPGALLRGEAFFERDLHLDWYPRIEAIARSLGDGSWPLWDPSIGFGQPLLADPGAEVAYPGTWLVLPLRARGLSYTVFVLAHLALTAAGAFRLGRATGASRAGAAAGAALWVLSGPLQSSVNLWHHFAGACWMPWVVLGVERAVRTPGVPSALRLSVTAALQVLAGSPDVCAMTWTLSAGWAAFRLAARRRRAWPRTGTLVGAAVLAIGLSAVTWLPALDRVSRSARRALPDDVRAGWSVPPEGLLRTIVPLDPARVPFSPETWQRLYDRPEYPFLYSLYIGLPALFLGVAAVAGPRVRARAGFLGAVTALAVGFSLGPHGPVYPLATALVPPLRMLRYPSKAMLLAALAAALLAAMGVSVLGRGGLARRRWAGLGLALLAAAAAATVAGARYRAAGALGPAPLLAAGVAAVLVAHALGGARARLAAIAVTALAAADLLAAHSGLNATAPAELVFEPAPFLSHVDREGGRRLYVYDYHTTPGTSERLLGRPDPYRSAIPPAGWDPRRFQVLALRLYLPPPAAGLFGFEGSYDMDIRGLYPRCLDDLTRVLRQLEGTPAHSKLLRMGAVGTVVSLHTRGLEDLRPEATLPSLFPEPIRVWRVPGAPPRSWVVGCARVADGGDAIPALVDPGFDPMREVILPAPVAGGSGCGPDGTSRIAASRSDRVQLDVEARAPGFAVLADAWDPGWQVELDGRPAPLLRANVAFRAVAVPAGRHGIVMLYRPRPVLEGLALSLASLAVAAGLVAAGRRPSRGRARR
jgi:hypothetical protein